MLSEADERSYQKIILAKDKYIERLESNINRFLSIHETTRESDIAIIHRQKAEIERLQKENNVLKTNNQSLCKTLSNRARVERAEAYREFAEKLKAELAMCRFGLNGNYCITTGVSANDIDTTLKDLTESTDQTATSVSLIDGHIEK